MTNSPDRGSGNNPNINRRFWLIVLTRTSIVTGFISLLGIGGGAWWLSIFVNEKLAPLIEKELTDSLKRPIKLGKIQRISLTGMRFGPSALPATDTDKTNASAQAVEVGFNPLEVIINRSLNLDLTFIQPKLYAEQAKNGNWIKIETPGQQQAGPIKAEVNYIEFQNADVTLVPQNNPNITSNQPTETNKKSVTPPFPIIFNQVSGNAYLKDESHHIQFDVKGTAITGGNFKIKGEYLREKNQPAWPPSQVNLLIQAQNLLAADVDRLIPLPIDLQAGRIDANFTAALKATDKLPNLIGTATFRDVTAAIQPLPQKFTKANGLLRLKGQNVTVEDTSAFYGKTFGDATGTIDLNKGFNLAAKVKAVNVIDLLDTFEITLPIATKGEFKIDLKVTGDFNSPVVSGSLLNNKIAQVDKIDITRLSADFEIKENILTAKNIKVNPAAGGDISGNGKLKISEPLGLVADFLAKDIPGDAIAKVYNIPTAPIAIGKIQATTQIFGPPTNLKAIVNFQAAEASYATNGSLVINQNIAFLRDAKINVGTGNVTAQGFLDNKRFQILLNGEKIALDRLKTPPGIPLPLNQGEVNGNISIFGNTGAINLDTIQAEMQGKLSLAGGNVNARGLLNNGNWQAFINSNNLPLKSIDLKTILPNLANNQYIPTISLLQQTQIINSYLELRGNTKSLEPANIQAKGQVNLNIAGGNVNINQLNFTNNNLQAKVAISPLPLNQFITPELILKLPDAVPKPAINTLRQSKLNGVNLNIAANLDKSYNISNLQATGEIGLNIAGGNVNIRELNLKDNNIIAQINTAQIQTGEILPLLPGTLNSQLQIQTSLLSLKPENIRTSGNINFIPNKTALPGIFDYLAGSQLTAKFAWNGEKLNIENATAPGLNAQGYIIAAFPQGLPKINEFDLNVKASNFNLKSINLQALPVSLPTTPNIAGRVDFDGRIAGNLATPRINGNVGLYDFAINNIAVEPVLKGGFTSTLEKLDFNLAGKQDKIAFNLDFTKGFGIAALNSFNIQRGEAIASGTVQNNILITNLQNLALNTLNITPPLNNLPNNLKNIIGSGILAGNLTGKFDINLNNFAIAGTTNINNLRFGNINTQAVAAKFNWNGKKLELSDTSVNNLSIVSQGILAPKLSANGFITANFNNGFTPQIGEFDLNLQANKFNLQSLPIQSIISSLVPQYSAPAIQGEIDFKGNIAGTVTSPKLQGNIALYKFGINQIAFEPILQGGIKFTPQEGVDFYLNGKQEKIALNLDAYFQPVSFNIRQGEATVKGISRGEKLLVNLQSFPLATINLNLPFPIGPGIVTGNISGNLQLPRNLNNFDLAKLNTDGKVSIANFRIGRFNPGNLEAAFNVVNGVANLGNVELQQDGGKYLLRDTRITLDKNPQIQGNLSISNGQIKTILNAVQWFDVKDIARGLQPPTFGKAADIGTVESNLSKVSLLNQLRRISELDELVQQRENARRNNLPPLTDFQGTFGGEIKFAGSLQGNLSANFDLAGQNWQWGIVNFQNFVAKGSLDNGILTVVPFRLQSDNRLISFSGSLGGENLSGQLRVVNLPIIDLRNFLALVPVQEVRNIAATPIDITGNLNVTAALAGKKENPLARGEISLVEGTLNRQPIQTALGSFSYANARLNFGAGLRITGPEPLQINGSIPYRLPFMTVFPDSDRISLNVSVQNEGLALLNLVNNQIAWIKGEGKVELMVSGTVLRPEASGEAIFKNAEVKATALPENITGLTGTAKFKRDRISIENIQGLFSQGNLSITGVLPLVSNLQPEDKDFKNPLTVNLDKLAMNLRGIYKGNVNGKVLVNGSALLPKIGGEITLSDGQVLLSDPRSVTLATQSQQVNGIQPEFNNLKLILGDRVQVSRAPVLQFTADGKLQINGTINDIQPQGIIRLKRGEVNLFTTQFRVDRDYRETAEFIPNRGLDPILNVRLAALVSEVSNNKLPISTTVGGEINEQIIPGFTGSQTVRVIAQVNGPASELFDNLRLTSSPSRSEAEIVALIGGGFINTLGRGDSTLALANLAGSAILGNIQNIILDATNLSEFRLYPTIVPNDTSRGSTLGIAAEAGIDISKNMSASLLKILTAPTPLQFNLRYRVNNNLRIRTGTDFNDNNQMVIEYETRF